MGSVCRFCPDAEAPRCRPRASTRQPLRTLHRTERHRNPDWTIMPLSGSTSPGCACEPAHIGILEAVRYRHRSLDDVVGDPTADHDLADRAPHLRPAAVTQTGGDRVVGMKPRSLSSCPRPTSRNAEFMRRTARRGSRRDRSVLVQSTRSCSTSSAGAMRHRPPGRIDRPPSPSRADRRRSRRPSRAREPPKEATHRVGVAGKAELFAEIGHDVGERAPVRAGWDDRVRALRADEPRSDPGTT